MFRRSTRWLAPLAATAAVLLTAPAANAVVSRPPQLQNFYFELDAEAVPQQGCDFDVSVTGTGGKITQIILPDGRIFTAGKGVLLTYTNIDPTDPGYGNTYTVKTAGSVAKYQELSPGGEVTATFTGHNGFVYFGNDDEGAGITQYTGKLVLTLESFATFRVDSIDATAGQAVDVCAALS